MIRIIATACLAILTASLTPLTGQNAQTTELSGNQALIAETRNDMEAWIQVRQDIAERRADWAAEQDILRGQIELLREEIKQYQEEIESAEEELTTAEQRQTELEQTRRTLSESIDVVEDAIPDLEAGVRELTPYFPEPLQDTETMRQLAGQLPQSRESSRTVSDRMVVLLGILNEVHKFNSNVTVATKIREVNGERLSLRTLFLGTGQAYFVAEDGSIAGRFLPQEGGEWTFEDQTDIAAAVQRAIRFYRGEATTAPEYVGLPVDVSNPLNAPAAN